MGKTRNAGLDQSYKQESQLHLLYKKKAPLLVKKNEIEHKPR